MARANTMADITAGLADSTPDLSVIICNYRSAAIIQSCLASLCGQDYPAERYDIVIIDDGSQDESAEIIQRFIEDRAGKHPKISYHRKENEGLSIARNDGIRRSRGAIITYIDDDAVADRQFIIQVMASFREHPEANCVGGRVD
ncbi:MAG: glycosyltransferase family 2 protein, partial [Candidatus Marinimicrobia bacterium]|nr:glycosyltransferase family 2 protein [Candidatus Neomarinimicrobiota bacterium]